MSWLESNTSSNRFVRSYIQGFVDISGGKLLLRNDDASLNRLFVTNEISTDVGVHLPDNSFLLSYTPPLDFSNNFATVWTSRSTDTSKNFTGVSMSANGQYQFACVNNTANRTVATNASGGTIHISRDYGVNWTSLYNNTGTNDISGARAWSSICNSSDGKYVFAAVNDITATTGSGYIYKSNNYGVSSSWTALGATTNINGFKKWSSICCSADGTYVYATEQKNLYKSTDYGSTWSNSGLIPDASLTSICTSTNGKYVTACCSVYVLNNTSLGTTNGSIYCSSNYANTFKQISSLSKYWLSVAMSATGQYQIALSNDNLYLSIDYGNSWTSKYNVTINATFSSCAISANGQIIFFTTTSYNTSSSYIYYSINYGDTFTQYTLVSNKNFNSSVCMSANAQYITVCSYGISGYIHSSVIPYTELYTGNIFASQTIQATSFNATSDYRIKSNVKLLDTIYNVDNLKPVLYNNILINKQDIGFIAHEVQELYPFLVTGNKDDSKYQTLNYIGLIGILTREIQDLKKDVNQLKIEFGNIKHNNYSITFVDNSSNVTPDELV
jgi:hypothetical protein